MKSDCELYDDLLQIMEEQAIVIERQNKLIASLVNENLEKENYIDMLASECNFEP